MLRLLIVSLSSRKWSHKKNSKKENWILIVFYSVHITLSIHCSEVPTNVTLSTVFVLRMVALQDVEMSRIFVSLCGLCPKADPMQWSGVSVVNLMSRDWGTSRTKAGFILYLGKVSYNGRGFISVFFCYLFNLVMERAWL